MGLDIAVKSIISEIPGSKYFDQEQYDWEIGEAEYLNEAMRKLGFDVDFRKPAGLCVARYNIGGYHILHELRRFAAELDGLDLDEYLRRHGPQLSFETRYGLYSCKYYLRSGD